MGRTLGLTGASKPFSLCPPHPPSEHYIAPELLPAGKGAMTCMNGESSNPCWTGLEGPVCWAWTHRLMGMRLSPATAKICLLPVNGCRGRALKDIFRVRILKFGSNPLYKAGPAIFLVSGLGPSSTSLSLSWLHYHAWS